jgi:AcrR family transcriptional regulator
MSPRPRLTSDTDILKAVFRTIARLGPAKLTLADVAEDAGLSPAALVQRFGSKRALLCAAAADAASGHAFLFAGLRERHASPVAALIGLADCMALLGGTRAEVAHSLAFFRMDLEDEEFRQQARIGAKTFHTGIRSLLRDAIAAGEIVDCDTAVLARLVQATLNGSMLAWALEGEGEFAVWVKRDLRALLRVYRDRA